MTEKAFDGWAIKLRTKDWTSFAGILFFTVYADNPVITYHTAEHMGIRTMVFRTRQQARNACTDVFKRNDWQKRTYRAQIVKVQASLREIT